MFRLRQNKVLTDEEAMERFQNGDARGFDLLLDRYKGGVLRFIMKMVGTNKPQAEDLLQEIFLKIIERRNKYNPNHQFSTWLYSIARNHCIDFLRSESYRRHDSLDAPFKGQDSEGAVVLEIVRSQEKTPEDKAYDIELRVLIDNGIQALREEFREVFLLREVQGLSFHEIAEITEAPLGTVKSRLRYAFQQLRQSFEESGYFEQQEGAKGV